MSDIEAVGSAVEKTAELGTQALKTTEKTGRFFARVFKEPIETGVGILNDKLRVIRLKRWDQMADEVDEILRRRGVVDTKAVPPKLGLPLLEAASLEDEPQLQALWSRLLANAMDPGFVAELRVAYTDIIANMNPIDAKLLSVIYASLRHADRLDFERAEQTPFTASSVCEKLSISRDDYMVSIDNLIRQRCLAPFVQRVRLGGALAMDGRAEHLSSIPGNGSVVLTPLGIRFVEACTDPADSDRSETLDAGFGFTQTIDVGIRVV